MAYEMKDNTFSFEYRAENIDQKFPAIQAAIKICGVQHDLAVWIRNGKYGKQYSGDAKKLIPFMKAMFGAGSKAQAIAQQKPAQQQEPTKQEIVDRKTLLR